MTHLFRLSLYPVGDSYLLVAVAALALLGLMVLGPGSSRLTRGRRIALAGVRLVVIVLVILAMLRPTLVYTESKKQSATLVVLVDATRSMTVPDAYGDKPRYEVVRRALIDASPQLARLGREFEIKAYTFDSEAHAAEVSDGKIRLPESPDGKETAIGAVLEDVLRYEAGKRLLGVVLLSDGAQRAYAPRDMPPQSAASRLKYLGYPLYTIAVGQSRQGRDVALKELLVNDTVFVKNRLEIAGQVRIDGYTNQQVPLQLWVESSQGQRQAVEQTEVAATAGDQLVPFAFAWVPTVPGEYKLTVEAQQQPGERVVSNNQMSAFVNVLKGGLNALYIEGDLRWELKYLRRSLGASPDIKIDYLRLDAQHPETNPGKLLDRFQPGKYDVYILGDVDAAAFRNEELVQLTRAVSQGAGLVMLGGYHSFGPGGYASTPLATVLPVRMDPLERQDFDRPGRKDVQLLGSVKMRPTTYGQRHFTMRLASDPRESDELWNRLPALTGANRFQGLSPAAQTLAEDDDHNPLLVIQAFGNGRSMAFAGDSTWRWVTHGFEASHKRFWRQVVLWLARKDESNEGNVWVKLQQRRLAPLQRAEFLVGAQSATGDPLTDVRGEAEVTLPDGTKRPVQLIRQDNLLSGNFRETQSPGDYTVTATVQQDKAVVGAAHARFLVYQQDLELDNAAADKPLLENLARMTGGESIGPEQLPALIEKFSKNADNLLVQTETKRTFWDSWPFFLLFVGLLGAEWYLRKRWGLV